MAKEKLFQVGIKALITNNQGQILMLDSGTWHLKHQRRHWDIPGGRIQQGHSALETLKREVEEETGIRRISKPEFFTAVVSNFKDISIGGFKTGLLLMIYKVKIPKTAKITLSQEHAGYKWMSPNQAAKELTYKYPKEFTELLLKDAERMPRQ